MEIRKLIKIVLLALCCLIVHILTMKGQGLYSENSKITVASNTTLTINGSVENTGILDNNGHVKVAGQWINSGTYNAGEGMITFNSTSSTIPQVIHHNGQIFNRLTLAGGTKKVILSDIRVGREIRFDNGIIEMAGSSILTFAPDAEIIGASDRSHIHGPVFHIGSGPKLFPIGNGLVYLPVELKGVTDPSAVIGVRAFEFDNLSLAKAATLKSISDKRYWHIDVASGSLANAQVVLPLRGESWIADPEKVVVVQSASPTENFTSIGRSSFSEANYGRVASKSGLTMPFVALATLGAEITVYNAVSPNGDRSNDYLRIDNIENYTPNRFSVFNRWGDKVFEIENYDNGDRAFKGSANVSGAVELVTGTYFYVLDLPQGESLRGFIAVKK